MSQYPDPSQQPPAPQSGVQPQYPAHPQAYQPPAYGQPVYQQPAYGQPVYQQPAYGQPMYGYGPAPVPKPTGWFVVNWLFFWPIAIYSLVSHWNKIDLCAYSGDIAGAQFHAAKVRKLGIISLCITVGIWLLYIVFFVVLFSSVSTYSRY